MDDINEEKYERAKKLIKSEKEWYSHFFAYIFFCTMEQLFYAGIFDEGMFTSYIPLWVRFVTPILWGIALLLHWLYVFKGIRFNGFYKNWEQRKIKEYMEKEEEDYIDNRVLKE